MVDKVLFSKKKDDWKTPSYIYDAHMEIGYFDPCPLNHDMSWDGLKIDWKKHTFVNPPYSNIRAWLEKAFLEIQKGNSENVVFLIPARTDVKWFHDLLYMKDNVLIEFIKGRLKFGDQKNNAPFPSMLVHINKKGFPYRKNC